MALILTTDFCDQKLKKRKQNKTTTEKKNKKTNKTHRKKIFSCQLCGRCDLSKNTSIPQSLVALGRHAYIHAIAFNNWRCLPQRTSSEFCSHSFRCEPMPLFRGETFSVFSFLGIVIQTTSKHWAQWSLYLLCSLTGMRRRCVYCECVHSEAPGPFISFFIEVDGASEHKSKTWKRKGRTRGLLFWSRASFPLPVNL